MVMTIGGLGSVVLIFRYPDNSKAQMHSLFSSPSFCPNTRSYLHTINRCARDRCFYYSLPHTGMRTESRFCICCQRPLLCIFCLPFLLQSIGKGKPHVCMSSYISRAAGRTSTRRVQYIHTYNLQSVI